MPMARPGLWYGRPFSLACSALEQDMSLCHSLGSPSGCGFAFRAGDLGPANPQIPSKLMNSSSQDSMMPQGR